MKIGEAIGSIIKPALVVGLIYAAVNWQDNDKADDDANLFAKRACVVEIGRRFSVSRIGVYEISENRNGYVVRANVTLTKGSSAKVICLTNIHGGVRDITIEER